MLVHKNILVTGAAGYIGSHACKALHKMGLVPIGVDNLSTGWREAVKYGPFIDADLMDKQSLLEIFKQFKPGAVMHFAAYSQVGESVVDPGKYWRNNVLGSLNLIEASVESGCKNFIFSSTCAIYGDQDNVLLSEKSEQAPNNAYGMSKRAVEEILKHFSAVSELRHVIFRYFNVAGADPDSEIGEFHRPETHLIPLILDAIDGKRDKITIFGTDYPTPDGTCIRDYVHVSDLIEAHLLGLKWLRDGGSNNIFNLGTGSGFSVREVIDNVSLITNRTVPAVEGTRRLGDCAKLVSGSAKAFNTLGWVPERSTLKQMITDAWRWHQTNGYQK